MLMPEVCIFSGMSNHAINDDFKLFPCLQGQFKIRG